ncbi:hypothetical protein FRC11_011769, partial [Ceratobasidium sp. 423]
PESIAPPRPSGTSTSTASQDTSTYTAAPINNKSGGSNTGAIVGGVVGGVLGIALIALIAFIVIRKGKRTKPGPREPPPTQAELEQPTTTQFGGTHASYGHASSTFVPTTQPYYKPYDPSDPSTFPADSYTKSVNISDLVPPLSYSQNADTRPSHFRGIPEL